MVPKRPLLTFARDAFPTVWVGAHGDWLHDPYLAPRIQVEEFLHSSWQATRWAHLRKTRKHYAQVLQPDAVAMAANLRKARPPDEAGALQAVVGVEGR